MPHKHWTVQESYERLGVTPQQVRDSPQISHHLRRMAKIIKVQDVQIPRDPLYYLRASDDPAVRRVLEVRDSLPFGIARPPPWEAFCVKAGVPPQRLVEAMTDVVKVMSRQFSQVLAAVSHPKVTEKTIAIALTDDGQKDREILHRHAGFIQPAMQGAPTTVNVNASAKAEATTQVAVLAPPSEHTVRRLADRLNAARGLPPAREITALPQSTATELPQERLAREALPATLIPAVSQNRDTGIEELDADDTP
jgi:hypothetical protein